MEQGRYIEKIGRRKTSSARVRLFKGKGESIINGKPLDQYVDTVMRRGRIMLPFSVCGLSEKDYYFTVVTDGGGITGQAEAIMLGLSRILASLDETYKAALKKEKLLTRDPRMVERKKVFLVKARKRPQYSKR
jgi:small subunit ribosomal protein S9